MFAFTLGYNMSSDKSFDKSFNKKEFLKPKYWGSWILIGILGIISFIPRFLRDWFANFLAFLVYKLPIRFKYYVLVNIVLCFPELNYQERDKIYHEFLRVGLKTILGYGELFFRSDKYIADSFIVTGKEFLDEAVALNKPIVFMAPHGWAIDHCGIYLSQIGLPMCTMMHTSKNAVFDWFMNSMRLRYGGKVFERSSGIKSVIKALKEGYHCYFLPDQDLGRNKSSIFVNLFARKKSSLIVLPKLAELGDAIIVPFFSTYNEEARKYEVIFDKYLENYPSGDLEADVRRMNESIEKYIKGREKQYMWFLSIFKTSEDPEEKGVYDMDNYEMKKRVWKK